MVKCRQREKGTDATYNYLQGISISLSKTYLCRKSYRKSKSSLFFLYIDDI